MEHTRQPDNSIAGGPALTQSLTLNYQMCMMCAMYYKLAMGILLRSVHDNNNDLSGSLCIQ